MTQHAHIFAADPDEAGEQVARLNDVLVLVEQIAGRGPGRAEVALDVAARIGAAYAEASPIVQRRFDAFAGDVAAWGAAGVEALIAAGSDANPPRAAAAALADELAVALSALAGILRL